MKNEGNFAKKNTNGFFNINKTINKLWLPPKDVLITNVDVSSKVSLV